MRYWEIDFFRGVAIIGMIFYHLLVDLELFLGWHIGVFDYPIVSLSRIVGFTFTFLLGLSTFLQFQKENSPKPIVKKALILLWCSLVISATTFIFFPSEFIYFGILHLLGISSILLIPFLRFKSNLLLFFIGLLVVVLGITISIPVRASLDFYPPIPWFGFSLWGLAFAKTYLPWRISKTLPPKYKFIQNLGRHSLLTYLIHQPILLAILYLTSKILS